MSKINGKKEVVEKIQKWLNEESIDFAKVEQSYLDFKFDIKNPNISIFSYNDKPDSMEFGAYASLTELDKKAFEHKKIEEKLQILWDLERSLIEINVGYVFLPNHLNLERLQFSKKIYFDGLSKDKFMDTIFALQRSYKLVELMLRQLTGKHYSNFITTFIL